MEGIINFHIKGVVFMHGPTWVIVYKREHNSKAIHATYGYMEYKTNAMAQAYF